MTLKSKQIEHAGTGMHADGQGLYLRVQPGGSKGWIYRYQIDGRRREMGLGTLAERPAPDAREHAAELRKLVRRGVDPIEARNREVTAVAVARMVPMASTFDDVAAEYIKAHRAGWSNPKHASQWENTLDTYASPMIGSKQVAGIDTDDVLRVLSPIWSTKTETASRVRSRIELVLDYAKVKKLRTGENPAIWRGNLDKLLPKPSKVTPVQHRPALPYGRVPEFMAALRAAPGYSARALEFAILTAARTGEVRLMQASEVDFEQKLWTVPAARMKARREHRVPLSDAAVALLKAVIPVASNPYLFPGAVDGRPLSDMALSTTVRRMNKLTDTPRWLDPRTGAEVVPHGFRSSFRDWIAEATAYANELGEMALAHTVGDAVEAAYRRGDMFERRREMMQKWADYLDR